MKKDMNKEPEKESRLLESGFKLFINKGFQDTSIQEIVDDAGVAKGTFYTYFKDKYDIRNKLIAKKSNKLFNDAYKKLKKTDINKLDEQVIFIVDYIINYLEKNKLLLQFISKNLSWGIYTKTINELYQKNETENNTILELFLNGIKEQNIKLENPEVTLYMIIELVSSTCFNSILYKEPLPINEFKPYLYNEIRKLIND
ncbi:MAG: TetR/AcrR family transcriptional regulator [Clostridia bacterium]|nr:TetR/AcrR family transcriptional regulator [Clostridia bacterium]